MSRLFLPTARQTNFLLIAGFVSLGYALYLRYLVIEQSSVSLACEGGLQTWLCLTRRIVTLLFRHGVFGWAAIVAAVLNFIRPSIMFLALGVVTAAFGIVLYNVALSALAVSLLLLSLARRAAATE